MSLQDLQLDLEELNKLLTQATRQNVIAHLKAKTQLIEKQIVALTPQPVQEEEVKQLQPAEVDPLVYTPITKYSFDTEGSKVKVYFSLNGVGDVPKENVTVDFTKESFDLKIRGYNNQNLRYAIKKLCGPIDVKQSKFTHGKNTITLTLQKADSAYWSQLQFKEAPFKTDKLEKKNEDPQASLMNMMKEMYQSGDDEMKKTIAQAWQKSQAEKGGMGGMGGMGF